MIKGLSSQQVLGALYDQAPFAVMISDTDRNIMTCNAAFEQLFGYTKEELVGQSTQTVYSRQAEYDRLRSAYDTLLQRPLAAPIEIRYRRKNGEIFLASTQGTSVRDDDGNIVAMIGVIQNISEQRQIEQEFTSLFDYAPVYILQKDADNRIMRINALYADLLGLSPDEAVGRNLDDIQPALADLMRAEDSAIMASKEPMLGILHEIDSPTRGKVWVRANKVPFKSAVTEEDTILVIAMDVTELINRETELEAKTRNLESFAHAASHDLQEPLRKIAMFASIFAAPTSDAAERKHAIAVVTESARRARATISDLLAYSRASNAEIRCSEFELVTAIDEAMEPLSMVIEEARARVVFDVGDIMIEADHSQTVQLLQNLIGNAIKYRDQNRACRVEITAATGADGATVVSVSDNGVGFEDQFADRIFDPFVRLHSRSEIAGSGLGLAICKAVADTHGWTITTSSTPGAGSRFTIEMAPLKPAICAAAGQ